MVKKKYIFNSNVYIAVVSRTRGPLWKFGQGKAGHTALRIERRLDWPAMGSQTSSIHAWQNEPHSEDDADHEASKPK